MGAFFNKDVDLYTFRHSFVINMIKHGCDLERLKRVLGHANINTTAVYLQFSDADVQQICQLVPFLTK